MKIEFNQLPSEIPKTEIQPQSQEPIIPTSNNYDSELIDILSEDARGIEEFSEDYEIISDEIGEKPTIAFEQESKTEDVRKEDHVNSVNTTRMWMDLREMAQSLGFSLYGDGNINEFQKYCFHPAHKENLIRAWSRVVSHYNLPPPPPMIDIAIAEAAANAPLIALLNQNRKMRLELEKLRKENTELKKEIPVEPYGRPDQATLWKIDNDGYFEYTKRDGKFVRLKKAEKRTIPIPKDEVLERLIRHNGEEKVKKVFNI